MQPVQCVCMRPEPDEHPCVRCELRCPFSSTLSAGRTGRICKLCYNATRALGDWFKKRGRSEEWSKMPAAKKKKMILENRTVARKGAKREVIVHEEVLVSDKLGYEGECYHTNKIELLD